MRYRLIPTQGRSRPTHIECPSDADALRIAETHTFQHDDQALLVCAAPEGGLVREVGIVGGDPKPRRVRR
jgi:translation elongation factor EF-Tu-like GTPase